MLPAPSSLALEHFRNGAASASLGNLCSIYLNFPSYSLKPFPYVLSLQFLMQSSSLTSLQTLEGAVRPPSNLLQAEQPLLSHLVSLGEMLQSSYQLCALLWTWSSISISFFILGHTVHSISDGVSQERGRILYPEDGETLYKLFIESLCS